MTLADAANTVSQAATESVNAASAPSGGVAGRITVAVAALLLPVLWGLAVHLVFNWLARRRDETPSEDPVTRDEPT